MRYIPGIILVFTFGLVSCSSTIWERSPSDVKALFSKGDYSFLSKLNDKALLAAAPELLGDGAGFYIGTILVDQKNYKGAEHFLQWSLEKEKSPWQTASGKQLYQLYSETKSWDKAAAVARRLCLLEPQDKENTRRLAAALYWAKQDEAVLEVAAAWKTGDFSPAEELENQLYKAVVLTRLGRGEEAVPLWKTLVYDTPASLLHYRIYSFFEEDPTRYDLLGPLGRATVLFQSMAGQGQTQEAEDWFKTTTLPGEFWNHPALIKGLETLFKAESRAEKGLAFLEKFREKVAPEARYEAAFARGRFLRSLERWGEARSAFLTALPLAPQEEKPRCEWNWLQSWVKVQPAGALSAFQEVLGKTPDPGYFSDVLSSWLSELVQKRSWSVIAGAYRELGSRMQAEDRISYSFVLARLSRHGLVDLVKEGIGKTEAELLGEAINLQPYSYEALVARGILDRPLELAQAPKEKADAPPVEDTEPGHSSDKPEFEKDFEQLADGYLAYGLVQRASDLVLKNAARVTPKLARKTVEALQSREQYRDSLVLLYNLMDNPGYKMDRRDWEMLFPQAYLSFSEEQSQTQRVDLSLLQGLMRTESSFDAKARSWVGAQGLTQLMPETAAYTAKKLKMAKYDLLDPHDNITLGAKYLAISIENQERIFLALMAYNAGGGRIRSWKASIGALPEEVFVEAVPFTETRYYVKKVLSSTVMYGVLYHNKTLAQMVQMIYPNFQP